MLGYFYKKAWNSKETTWKNWAYLVGFLFPRFPLQNHIKVLIQSYDWKISQSCHILFLLFQKPKPVPKVRLFLEPPIHPNHTSIQHLVKQLKQLEILTISKLTIKHHRVDFECHVYDFDMKSIGTTVWPNINIQNEV